MQDKTRYTFSGHESFYCKSLWLKKRYDLVSANKNFNDAGAVVDLGVGKNMVSAIRLTAQKSTDNSVTAKLIFC